MKTRCSAWVLSAVFAFACGGNDKGGDVDAGVRPDAAPEEAVCGDGIVNGDEECDDANNRNDDSCRTNCRLTCGDGELGGDELCDVAIASGEVGACPVDCDDADACTQDALSGADCAQECVYAQVTAAVNGDDCCPAAQNANTDDDCSPECGNGAVESGEVCDTAITSGDPGACPTACDDTLACTTDVLANDGTCQAACSFTPITANVDDDGCCPSGATVADDNDCSPGCGDGVVTSPLETCDTAIAQGDPGACPLSCDDGNACTTEQLVSGGTCTAACSQTGTITSPANGDGCCPPGAHANNDNDCAPVCGNSQVETGETCDDGGRVPGDGCSDTCQLEAVAFRITDLDLRDPHVYIDFLGCRDVTDQLFFGFAVNPALQTAVQTDDDMDGELDLSLVLRFDPLHPAAATTGLEFIEAVCTAPEATTTCVPDAMGTTVTSTANNTLAPMMPASCLGAIAGTTRPYSPAISTPGGPCFASDAESITVSLSGIPVTLSDARIAARYVGSPATNLVSGLIRGFISEADADATILPMDLPLIGGSPLSFVLPGGDPPGNNNANCRNASNHDDKDVGPGGVTGWYFYLNFTARVVPYTP